MIILTVEFFNYFELNREFNLFFVIIKSKLQKFTRNTTTINSLSITNWSFKSSHPPVPFPDTLSRPTSIPVGRNKLYRNRSNRGAQSRESSRRPRRSILTWLSKLLISSLLNRSSVLSLWKTKHSLYSHRLWAQELLQIEKTHIQFQFPKCTFNHPQELS